MSYRVAVVGATGAVGTVMRAKLKERGFPAETIVPFASERSEGRELDGVPCRVLSDESIQGFDIALFSAGATTSRAWAQKFVDAGAVVVDNSSAFRKDPEIPLVVSEVNPDALEGHRGLIANPNCSTMQLMVALKPIHEAAGIDRLIVSTYQSVSGTGVKAVKELEDQTRAALAGDALPDPAVYPHHIAFNVLGGAGNFPDGDDHTDEERKMMFETRKILGDESIKIAVTCARVPVRSSHSESVSLETKRDLSVDEARRLLENQPGLIMVDDPTTHAYPTALDSAGRDEVFVGRLRRDPTHDRGLQMWVVSDNLLKGAATNAVQIAEVLHQRGLVKVPTAA
ncbi:aspartate-semialdehyde dehydrogenase [Solirubrobacter soli]|uniref:aspartate-semialdehyde dehydrogenase n=1 Tax=Solirubrobacter soli TaxID=363832 RepID=UPI0004864A77|nr:aspartate-semialdehyde dehydrogenase [Solirubrobacter soli]